MRLLGVAALVCLAFASVSALGTSTAVAAAQDNDSTLFTALGETQSATVPDGALGAFFLVEGGGGKGYNGLGAPSSGGAGASLTGTVLLQPDDVLTINVGSQGVSNQLSAGNPAPAWGGDGPGGTSYGNGKTVGGGGGGASSVLLNGDVQLMAGGGGGGGGSGTLGGIDAGGGGTGGADGTGSSGGGGSGPGHGKGGGWGAESGMAGGAGAPEHDDAGPGGGGGGGWKGGSGGTGGGTGGGGGGGGGAGASYLGSAVLDGTIDTASQTADGQVVVTWIYSPVCLDTFTQTVSASEATQFPLPCFFQGVPGTQITFGIGQHGTPSVIDAATGTVEYTPYQDGWTGTDQFSYTLTNANGATATGMIYTLNQGNWAQPRLGTSQAGPGDPVVVTASGLQPNEKVQLELRSDKVHLATIHADGNGKVHAKVEIPDNAKTGSHHIALVGEKSGLHTAPITITYPKPAGSGTPWGGIALGVVLGAVLVTIVGAALAVRRRHQQRGPSTT